MEMTQILDALNALNPVIFSYGVAGMRTTYSLLLVVILPLMVTL